MTASRCPIRSRMHWPRRAPRSAENSIRQEKGAPRQGAPDRLRSDRPGSVAGAGLQPGLGATQDQGMHVVGALVGVDRLEVEVVTDHLVLIGNAVSALHVAGVWRDVARSEGRRAGKKLFCRGRFRETP